MHRKIAQGEIRGYSVVSSSSGVISGGRWHKALTYRLVIAKARLMIGTRCFALPLGLGMDSLFEWLPTSPLKLTIHSIRDSLLPFDHPQQMKLRGG